MNIVAEEEAAAEEKDEEFSSWVVWGDLFYSAVVASV